MYYQWIFKQKTDKNFIKMKKELTNQLTTIEKIYRFCGT